MWSVVGSAEEFNLHFRCCLKSVLFKMHYLLIESPSKMMKNAFSFISKALSVIKIFKFLSKLFGHARKTAWL